ncbi:MAG: osmotically inducible protein C [Sulfobacillus thermosulfidooxidans]|uniref:Osmotically inducible protein C n=1 Tax=Sulfobacillus thermosulfidooxidans TaxID=28034 RepID=A0A2T2WRE5_SULTH|nr:MAG: osmotically inducible protein C [Sulfobacillus thermosulfidooxidans]
MATMAFEIKTQGKGATGFHRTNTAEFWSVEQRMGGEPEKPNPLELLLGSLTGCMNVVLQMVAHEKGWTEVRSEFHARGELDPRGLRGDASVPPYFHTVILEVSVSGIPGDDLDFVRKEVGRRCPVHRLIEQAGIPIQETWRVQ